MNHKKIAFLTLTLILLLNTPTASAENNPHLKVRANGTPLGIEFHGTRYEDPSITASFMCEGVINPVNTTGSFKVSLTYVAEGIYVEGSGRIDEIYDEMTEKWGQRYVINGMGQAFVDGEYRRGDAVYQIRVYTGLEQVSVDIYLDGVREIYVDGMPLVWFEFTEGESGKAEEKLVKLAEKFEEHQEKVEEKVEKLTEKFEEHQEKAEEKMEKQAEKSQERHEKVEEFKEKLSEQFETKWERWNSFLTKIFEVFSSKLNKLDD